MSRDRQDTSDYLINDTQPLMDESDEQPTCCSKTAKYLQKMKRMPRVYITVLILIIINLLNYIDRISIAALEEDVTKYFPNVNFQLFGLLQTVFICSYMVCSPVFGFLGDRYNRKYIMAVGITCWSVVTLASSFAASTQFWLFITTRALVGIGEATYSTLAPTIFGDLFVGEERTNILGLFYFAIPVGGGLGYISAQAVKSAFGWQWALRITPIIGIVCVVLYSFFALEPVRGSAESAKGLKTTSMIEDIKDLSKNGAFLFVSLGMTSVCFVTGGLAWWAPTFLKDGFEIYNSGSYIAQNTNFVFGVVTMLSGIIGVIGGSQLSRILSKKVASAASLVSATGMLVGAPLLYLALVVCSYNPPLCLVLVFFGETVVFFTWSLVTEITLEVVIPTRRAAASGYQMVVAHAFGDAPGPWIIGAISSALNTYLSDYVSLQYALYTTPVAAALGGAAFLACAILYPNAAHRVKKSILESRAAALDNSPVISILSGNPITSCGSATA